MYTPYTLSLPNFAPNFKTLSQVVPEKSLTEKKLADTYTNIVTEKAKTIYPLILRCRVYNDAAVANVAAVAVVNNAVVAVINVVEVVNVAAVAVVNVAEAAPIYVAAVALSMLLQLQLSILLQLKLSMLLQLH